jgi:putative phosphoribosyl transferase
MRAAARSVRKGYPTQLILAVPVGSREACSSLQAEADRVVCLSQPDPFWAVGLYYAHFEPTEDDEVRRILAEAHSHPTEPGESAPSGTEGPAQAATTISGRGNR